MTCRIEFSVRRLLLLAVGAATAAGLGWATPAQAQLGLPRVSLPTLQRELPQPSAGTAPLQNLVRAATLRETIVRELLRDHADALEADPAGEPVRRHELLLVSPAQAVIDAALAQGFAVLREQLLPELELRHVVLRPPPGMPTSQALASLRALDPQAEADFNHIYTRAGETLANAAPPASSAPGSRRVGLVDSGLDRQHPAFRDADIRVWGCNNAQAPSPHGTAVASLLVGRDGAFSGAAAGSVLFAADVFCGQPAAGAAENIAAALAWMAHEQVGVVNISLVGPPNRLLERSVQALARKGHLVVAAVGNDGPAAPALYPASYPGVVGVTGVNAARRVLPEAGQGPQVMFAAPGADLVVATPGGGYGAARGTSFAAPLVAGLLAESMQAPDRAAAAAALARLAQTALDLGAPGRDPVYGIGLVAEQARISPARVHADTR